LEKKIAFGFGNTVDYELVWSSQVYAQLIESYDIHKCDLVQPDELDSERNIVISILAAMKDEVGMHRPVPDDKLLDTFTGRFEKHITLGGTGVRAALALHKIGIGAFVHLSQTNEYTRALLPKDDTYVCGWPKDRICPHVIIQYTQESIVCENDIHIAPSRANRVILSNDISNSDLVLSHEFYEHTILPAKVLQLGCLEPMVDVDVMDRISGYLNRVIPMAKARGTIIFIEMGHHHTMLARRYFLERLSSQADILSMNEDEMQDLLGYPVDLLDAGQIAVAIPELQQIVGSPYIIVHSRYWALGYGPHAAFLEESLKAGVGLATTRFRFGDTFGLDDFHSTEALPLEGNSVRFCKKLCENPLFCCVGSYEVKEKHVTTIGLGDTFVGGVMSKLSLLDRKKLV
jgi:ADP-dependent phosphofructokinase/glucokinase